MEENLYGHITTEAFYHTLLPFKTEIYGDAMSAFGGYDMNEAVIYAFAGAYLAIVILYVAGRLLAPYISRKMGDRYGRLQGNLKWLLPLAAFAANSPFGFAIALALGLFRSPFWLVLPVAAVSVYFGYYSAWVSA